MVYLDSSALVKLVVAEPETQALRRFLRRHPERISCALARTEVLRAIRHVGGRSLQRARHVLRRVNLIRLDEGLLDAAGLLEPRIVRSLDAIHLAAALLVTSELEAFVTYDRRLAEGAVMLGLAVERPS